MLSDRGARAALAVVLALAAGCSFKNNGISVTDPDAGDELGETTGGNGGTGSGTGGTGGFVSRDGSAADRMTVGDLAPGDDGPLPPAPDAGPLPVDMAPDAPPLALGAACSADGACGSGFCVDKVCCDKRCGDPCFSCGGVTTGVAAGTCHADVANTACGAAMCSGATHTPASRCDGNGACVPRPAAPCPGNLTCASGSACKIKCAGDGDCTGGMVCDVAAGTCHPPGKPNGQGCMAGSDCSSGNCADGVCCDAPCVGSCRACRMAATGKPDGVCANLPAGVKDAACAVQDPASCGRDGTCDGAGHCHLYNAGTKCGTECCRDNSGPGGGPRVCSYDCNGAGVCDKTKPMIVDKCGGGLACCCPNTAMGPACVNLPALCPGACVQ